MAKPKKMTVRPANTQISLGIRPVWSESSLCTQWVAKDPRFLHADSEDSDQTGRMPRLIWVFAGRILTLLVLSCRGSFSCTMVSMNNCISPNVVQANSIFILLRLGLQSGWFDFAEIYYKVWPLSAFIQQKYSLSLTFYKGSNVIYMLKTEVVEMDAISKFKFDLVSKCLAIRKRAHLI